MRLDNLEQRGGGVIGVQSRDGQVFDAIVFGEREPGRWMAGSDGFRRYAERRRPRRGGGDERPVHVAIAYSEDGTIRVYRDGQPYGTAYKSPGLVPFAAGEANVVFGMRHAPAGGNKMLAGTIVRARLYDRALDPAEVAASAGTFGDYVSPEAIAGPCPTSCARSVPGCSGWSQNCASSRPGRPTRRMPFPHARRA